MEVMAFSSSILIESAARLRKCFQAWMLENTDRDGIHKTHHSMIHFACKSERCRKTQMQFKANLLLSFQDER